MLKKEVWFTKARDVNAILKIMDEHAAKNEGRVEVIESLRLCGTDSVLPVWIEDALEYLIKKHGEKNAAMYFEQFLYDIKPPHLEPASRVKVWRPERLQ